LLVEVFREAPGSEIQVQSLRGRLRFAVLRTKVVQRAPVVGGRLTLAGGRARGLGIADGPGEPDVKLRVERLRVREMSPRSEMPAFFDPDSGRCLTFRSSGSRSTGPGALLLPVDVTEWHYTGWSYSGAWSESHRPLPPATEMVAVDGEVIGSHEFAITWPQ
jgi:hypothetical protein